jgi:hypothetical protein
MYGSKKLKGRRKASFGIRLALLCCAVLFIAAGIARGDAAALWQKAVFVCLECVGIG